MQCRLYISSNSTNTHKYTETRRLFYRKISTFNSNGFCNQFLVLPWIFVIKNPLKEHCWDSLIYFCVSFYKMPNVWLDSQKKNRNICAMNIRLSPKKTHIHVINWTNEMIKFFFIMGHTFCWILIKNTVILV